MLRIPISTVLVSTRIRKDTGDIDALAADMQKHGLINPITVMDCQNGRYQLIAGLRRLEAAKKVQMSELRATVLSPMQAEEMLALEFAENEQRLNFTTAERLEYAGKIKAIEQAKARERMALHARDGYEKNQGTAKRPYPEKGEARDKVANKAGFSSTTQMRRAEHIAMKRPDLLSKIDSGETTIFGAYKETVGKAAGIEDSLATAQVQETKASEQRATSIDQVARAGVIRLMKNPHFLELKEELGNMRTQATAAKNTLKRATEAYDNKVKHFENNIGFLSRRVKELEEENDALRARLGMEARHVKRVEFGNPDGIIRIPEDTLS